MRISEPNKINTTDVSSMISVAYPLRDIEDSHAIKITGKYHKHHCWSGDINATKMPLETTNLVSICITISVLVSNVIRRYKALGSKEFVNMSTLASIPVTAEVD